MRRSTIQLLFTALLFIGCKKENATDNSVETAPPVLKENEIQVNKLIAGFYSALPVHYNESNKRYPLLLFIHGGGQYGNGKQDLPMLLREAIPELLSEKTFPPAFKVNGTMYSFIVLAPQFSGHPENDQLYSFVNYALNNYRIDASRIYIAGMSEGAEISCDFAAEHTSSIAALVTMAGASRHGDIVQKCKNIADGRLPVWAFHNSDDEVIDIHYTQDFINLINGFSPAIPARFTKLKTFGLFGHDAWSKASDPAYKEEGKNIYEWMLQYQRN